MAFRALAAVFFALLTVSFASAQSCPPCNGIGANVVSGVIGMLTDTSRNLQTVAKFDTTNFQNQVPQLAAGFASITNSLSMFLSFQAYVPSNFAYPDADAQLIVDSLRTFVRVHQDLLAIVIGDKGFLAGAPYTAGFFEPIRLALVDLEKEVDFFAYALIAMIPTQKTAGQQQSDMLTGSIHNATVAYSTPYSSVTFNSGSGSTTQAVQIPGIGGRKMM